MPRVNAYRNVNRCLRILGQIAPINLRYNIFSKYNFRLYRNVDSVLVVAKATRFLSYKTFPKRKSILPLHLSSPRMITSPLSVRPCFLAIPSFRESRLSFFSIRPFSGRVLSRTLILYVALFAQVFAYNIINLYFICILSRHIRTND